VLSDPTFKGKLHFAIYRNALDYASMTVRTIAEALMANGETNFRVTVFIDGLARPLEQTVGLRLRRSGIPAKKVRGIKKEESDALLRLADAICGFVRDAMNGEPKMRTLFERSMRSGILIDVSEK